MTVFNGPVRMFGVSHVTDSLGSNHPQVGVLAREGDETYRWVYNNGNSQISKGHCATVSALTGYSVTVSTTTSNDMVVGVCKHATITTGAYGWLLTEGFVNVEMGGDNSCATGDLLGVGADGTFGLVDVATGNVGGFIGKAMESMASGASGSAYVRLTGL